MIGTARTLGAPTLDSPMAAVLGGRIGAQPRAVRERLVDWRRTLLARLVGGIVLLAVVAFDVLSVKT